MFCGRRFENFAPKDWPREMLSVDEWRNRSSLVSGIGPSCSHCGSLSPDVLMEKLREGWILGGSDKSYKWYLGSPRSSQEAKFYTPHLPLLAAEELLAMWKGGTLNHTLYVTPWLPSMSPDAPEWLKNG